MFRATSAEVVAGAHNIRKEELTQQVRKSSSFTIHPEWDRWQIINDIALIHLPDRLQLNGNVLKDVMTNVRN